MRYDRGDDVSGQPGDGCTDPRSVHDHWCGFCGALVTFSALMCQRLRVPPCCPRCGERDWRSDERSK